MQSAPVSNFPCARNQDADSWDGRSAHTSKCITQLMTMIGLAIGSACSHRGPPLMPHEFLLYRIWDALLILQVANA